jgi:ribonuclease HI
VSQTWDLYSDGGTLGASPSPLGGTWAWVAVGHAREAEASGVLTAADCGLPRVSCNVTELAAAVFALEAAPAGWRGVLWTDSRCTLLRVRRSPRQAKLNGVPAWLAARLAAAKARAGGYEVRALGGHPTRADLERGRFLTGEACSVHNVYCDRLCGLAGDRFLARLPRGTAS